MSLNVMTSSLSQPAACSSAGNDLLQQWKAKVPLDLIMDGTIDGRTVNGLKRAVSRASSSKVDLADATLLRNYLKQVSVAQQLAPTAMSSLGSADLVDMAGAMAAEGANLPNHVKSALVTNHIASLIEHGEHKDLMDAISPWQTGDFDHAKPKLGCLPDAMGAKIATFQKLIFKDIISSKIMQGAPAAPSLLKFAKLCLTYFDEVDMLELDDTAAAGLNSALDVWKFLVAILTDTLDPVYEAFSPIPASSCQMQVGGQQW